MYLYGPLQKLGRGLTQLTDSSDIARWAERLRDVSAAGLFHSKIFYDRERYSQMQALAQDNGVRLLRVDPLDDSLESVFGYLVAG